MTVVYPTDEYAHVPAAKTQDMHALGIRFKQDPHPDKISLGAGTYRDADGRPWVLPSYAAALIKLQQMPEYGHEYLPFSGCERFLGHARRLVFSPSAPASASASASDASTDTDLAIASVQTVGGTGAVHLGAAFLKAFTHHLRPSTVLIPAETWENHDATMRHVGFETQTYTYWSASDRGFEFDGMCRDLLLAPDKSIVVLHACGHNPTACDPSMEEWAVLKDIFVKKGHFAFFDNAYQGFVSGILEQDGRAINLFAKDVPLLVAQSLSKNAGLYGERLGALHIPCKDVETANRIKSQIVSLIRPEYSSPPRHGADLVSTVCEDSELFKSWMADLKTMTDRIRQARELLVRELGRLGTPGDWTFFTRQSGMFGYTPLTPRQCRALETKYHIYAPPSGRMSMPGINASNVSIIARAIDDVVRNF